MKPELEQTMDRLAYRARGRYAGVIADARARTRKAAGTVTRGKKPVRTLSKLGQKLSGLSHQTATELMKQQTKLLEAQIDGVALRLRAAANAEGWRDLLDTQLRLITEQAAGLAEEARLAFHTVKGAGSQARALVKGTVSELKGQKPAARKARPRTKPAARKPAAGKSRPRTKPAARAAQPAGVRREAESAVKVG